MRLTHIPMPDTAHSKQHWLAVRASFCFHVEFSKILLSRLYGQVLRCVWAFGVYVWDTRRLSEMVFTVMGKISEIWIQYVDVLMRGIKQKSTKREMNVFAPNSMLHRYWKHFLWARRKCQQWHSLHHGIIQENSLQKKLFVCIIVLIL